MTQRVRRVASFIGVVKGRSNVWCKLRLTAIGALSNLEREHTCATSPFPFTPSRTLHQVSRPPATYTFVSLDFNVWSQWTAINTQTSWGMYTSYLAYRVRKYNNDSDNSNTNISKNWWRKFPSDRHILKYFQHSRCLAHSHVQYTHTTSQEHREH